MYATAITGLLLDAGIDVVDVSETLVRRFEERFEEVPPDASIRATQDRQGVEITGESGAVEEVAGILETVSRDTFRWDAALPRSAIFTGRVERTGESGAIVQLGEPTGFLPFGRSKEFVEEGDRIEVQVIDPEPPWSVGRRAVVSQVPRVPGTYLDLTGDADGGPIVAPSRELHGLVELLSPELPAGWGVEVAPGAEEAALPLLEAELERAVDRAEAVDRAMDAAAAATEGPTAVERLEETAWCRFGREGRFALDDRRRVVTPTMDGHHRVKASGGEAASAVDFLERMTDADGAFDADAVLDTFGPVVGDRIRIEHGKPDGRAIELGPGEVAERPEAGAIAVRRELSAGGRLDALDVPKASGDVAETTFMEGQWWYPTVYRDAEGTVKGTYVNVGTPLEIFPDRVRYVDLLVDVVKDPDGEVRVVDEDELAAMDESGVVPSSLAEKARAVAAALERSLE